MAIDARWAQGRRVGAVGRGVLNLVPRLADSFSILALVDPRVGALDLEVVTKSMKLPLPAPSTVWLDICVPLALRGFNGIFHSPFYFLPARAPRSAIVSIHDISFETHPHLLPAVKGRYFRLRGRHAARVATRIVTGSVWSKTQLMEVYGVHEDRISLVKNGVAPEFRPLQDSDLEAHMALLRTLGLRREYLAAIGGAQRRRTDVAIEVWRELRSRGIEHDLVIYGEDGAEEPGLVFVPRPDDRDLRLLLAGASLLLYPTEMEGFGLPPLEAAACGTPTVCSHIGSLPEVLGDAAAWCEPGREAMTDRAASLLSDEPALRSLAGQAMNRARLWNWDDAAAELAAVYRSVIADR